MLADNRSKTAISGEGITQAYDRVVNKIINYTTSSGKVLKANGDKKITGITIMRTPIEASALLKVAHISLEDKPYDKLFHLYMVLTMENGKVLALEKNEVIKLSVYDGRKGAEEFKIPKFLQEHYQNCFKRQRIEWDTAIIDMMLSRTTVRIS